MNIMRVLMGVFIVSCLFAIQCQKKKNASAAAPYLKCNKTTLSETAAEGEDSVIISSNIDWKLKTLPSWLQASITSGNAGDTKIIFRYNANSGIEAQSTNIIADPSESNGLDPVIIQLIQNGAAPYLS